MEEKFLIISEENANANFTNIQNAIINNLDFNLKDFNVKIDYNIEEFIISYQNEIIDYIIQKGYTNFISIGKLFENISKKGSSSSITTILFKKFLDKIDVDNELIIIDPYFYGSSKIPNYPDMIVNILDDYLRTIDTLLIITSPYPSAIDSTVKNEIESKLKAKKTSLNIIHSQSDCFHDRFWITCQRKKGISTGTSMNGFGKKLSLIDLLNGEDVRDIIIALKNEGLI